MTEMKLKSIDIWSDRLDVWTTDAIDDSLYSIFKGRYGYNDFWDKHLSNNSFFTVQESGEPKFIIVYDGHIGSLIYQITVLIWETGEQWSEHTTPHTLSTLMEFVYNKIDKAPHEKI